MIADCSILIGNLDRLEALKQTGLFATAPEEAFTRLNHLATKFLNAPISIFSLIGGNSQFFKSAAGFEITPKNNEVPLDVSVCQYSLQGKPLSIEDTKNHPLFAENPAVLSLNIGGYLGIPVITKSGQAIGAVCVIDHKKRIWTKEEISILQDITASFISEIELRQAMASLEQEAKRREEFIAVASHELKNPLSGIKLQTQLVLRKLEKDNFTLEDNKKFLSNLERQTRRLELMIDDMSDAIRLSTGKLSLKRTQMSMNTLVSSIVKNTEAMSLESKNTIQINSQDELDGDWDSTRIEQVITNLLSNAFKYAPGSLIEITMKLKNNLAVIKISDNGPGISLENQKKIFEKYGRVSHTTSKQGLGLGLYISKQIIEEHSGTIELVSEENKGSAFTISLPL